MHFPKLKRGHRGYVLILICICIPLILLGAKLVVDFSTQQTMTLKNFYKRCGNAAALEVAKKWNPGLSLSYQKESMLRIADDVYNRSPAHNDGHAMWEAIPGLDMELPTGMRQRGIYNPLEPTGTKIISMSPSVRTVPYQDVQIQLGRNGYSGIISIGEPYRRVYNLKKYPAIVIEEAVIDFLPYTNPTNSNVYSTYSPYIVNNQLLSQFTVTKNTTYTTRVNPSDNRVELAIENDRIKVSTDGHPGYAVPAECNVDIVLAIPTNMAACNKDNRDANTTTSGVPTIITTNTASILDSATLAARTDVQNFRATPIYQIAQGLRRFLDENFKYTRGVNVGLIPYSGKLSIPPEKGDLWTEKFPSFNDSDASLNYIRSCFLYGTVGSKNTSLTTQYSAWGGYNCPERHGGYGIMMRGPLVPSANYGGNRYCVGDLLSTDDPATGNRFYRFNYRPCYGGYANLLSGKCEVNCTEYFYNPYFVVELTADVTKIYDLLNVFVPFNDQRNNSNFLFLPFVWANNLFQDWTKDPGCDAQDSSGSDDGRLSCPSKKQADRKRALILIVNKPDWFEPNELTYLGFDNDFSEIPMIESDCIRFDVNYSDTSRKFADGSSYNGSICGAKKILYYTTTSGTVRRNSDSGYYETSGSATGRLTFPKKHLIKIVVEPVMSWTNHGQKLTGDGWRNWGRIDNDGEKFFMNNIDGSIASSSDGINWTVISRVPISTNMDRANALIYGDGKLVSTPYASDNIVYVSTNKGSTWASYPYNCGQSDVSAYGNGLFLALERGAGNVKASYDGINWSHVGSFASIERNWNRAIGYCNGCWMVITWLGKVIASYDNGKTWSVVSAGDRSPGQVITTTEWYGVHYIYNRYWAERSGIGIVSSKDRVNWICEYKSNLIWQSGIGFKNGVFVAQGNGNIMTGRYQGTIQFKDISGMSNGVGSGTYTINDRKEFFIEPSQLSSNQLTFDMHNIRLISAEITNRPYTKVKPECRLSTSGNTAYITTNVRKPVRVTLNTTGTVTSSSVTFDNVNNSDIANVGTSSLLQPKTFIFPSSNFSNNYTVKKIKCSLVGAYISAAILDNQVYRMLNRTHDEGMNISYYIGSTDYGLSNERYVLNSNGTFTLTINNLPALINSYVYVDRSVDSYGNWGTPNVFCYFFSELLGRTNRVKYENQNVVKLTLNNSNLSTQSGQALFKITAPAISGYLNCTNRIFVSEIKVYPQGARTLNDGITFRDGIICFNGVGDLSVTVEPTIKDRSIYLYTTDGTKRTLTITADQDIVISPDEYLFEQQSDGTYRVSLGLNNVSVSNPTMIDTDYTCVYAKPRLPKMSATVDFSRNNGGRPAYDSNLIVYGENESGLISKTGVKYNASRGYWNTCLSPGVQTGVYTVFNGLSGWNHHYRRFTGEFYTMVDSVGDGTPQMLVLNKYHSLSNHQAKVDDAFYFGGIFRGYYGGGDVRNCGEYDGYDIVGNYGILDIYNLNSGAVCDFIMTGYTLPINTALHEAGYYEDTCDSMTALQKLTLDACSKLKESCGENLRIYIIRYRKQTQYKFLGKTMSYSYDYLNSCTNNIYDVSTEADLASRLKDIAEDIKNWAGYEPAKNVE